MGNARPIDGRPQSEVQVGPDKLEVVASFCYLGDMLSVGEGCEITVTSRVKTASYKTHGHVYSSCVATVRSSKLLEKLEPEDLDNILRERRFPGLCMWSVLVVQSEQHVIY